jgi:hypothetical protein
LQGNREIGDRIKWYLRKEMMNEGKIAPVNSATTAGISLPGGEIPLNPGNYKLLNFCYLKMYK